MRCMKGFLSDRGMPSESYGDSRLPYDGGPAAYSKPKSPAWPKLARVLSDLGTSPSSFMRFHFSKRMAHPPTPYQLASDKSIEEYRQFGLVLETSDIKYRLSMDAYEFKYRTKRNRKDFRTDQETWRCVLLEIYSGAKISPLFRYLIALSLSLHDVAAMWRTEAVIQYLDNRHLYDLHWSSILTPGLMQISEEEAGVVDDLSLPPAAPPELPVTTSPPAVIRA